MVALILILATASAMAADRDYVRKVRWKVEDGMLVTSTAMDREVYRCCPH